MSLLAMSPAYGTELPGAEPIDAAVQARLNAARAAKPSAYQPRTRHLDEAGDALFTNRLILEASPYLLQHAHNPVNWFAWGDEAFEVARRTGRPVLLSIGYSTCHWCHVMEEESFENLAIGDFLNRHYVAIKVDREERPDLDAVYMAAVQQLTGRGGWPMTTWLTPDREVFYGGTYFPPRRAPGQQRPGFLELLQHLAQLYREQPEVIASQVDKVVASVRAALTPAPSEEASLDSALATALERYREQYDPVNGGLARAPKFPSSLPVRLLLHRQALASDDELRSMATHTLDRMAAVGLFDHIAGGFHRYSTDSRWLVPHFEKMLYDNALLIPAYVEAWQLDGDPRMREVAQTTLGWLDREMSQADGGFYSATDADSLGPDGEREEGLFFTWTPAELREALGAEAAGRFAARYGVTTDGNFEGRTILHLATDPATLAKQSPLDEPAIVQELEASRSRLYAVRSARPAPLRDDKVLTSWNGLAISAFARAGFAFDDPALVARATRCGEFVWSRLRIDEQLLHAFAEGRAYGVAFLDDYAFVVAGYLDLFLATWDVRWLERAQALQRVLDSTFADEKGGGYFFTPDEHETLLVREKPLYDGAEPSGNAASLMNLLRLHTLTGRQDYRDRADALARAASATLRRAPTSGAEMLRAAAFDGAPKREIVVVGPAALRDPFEEVLRASFSPQRLVLTGDQAAIEQLTQAIPWAKGKRTRSGRVTAYVCQDRVCQLPTSDLDTFRQQLTSDPLTSGDDS